MTDQTTNKPQRTLEQQLADRDRQLGAVLKISNALFSKTNLDELVRECLEVSLETVNAGAGSIILYDPDAEKLVFRHVIGEAADSLTGLKLNPDQGICGEVFQSGEAKISEDMTKEKRHLREVGERVHYVTQNMVTVPLRSLWGSPVGVMQVLNKHDGDFDQQDLELLTILAAQAATAIENARLHEEAKLAVVVKLMGDISHDIKNMITPVTTCTQTLDMLFDQMFQTVDPVLDELRPVRADLTERLEGAWEFLRGFYKEAGEMILDGAQATQERVREIADCVKGIVAEPTFELVVANELIQKVAKPLRLVAEKRGVSLVLDELDPQLPPTMIDQKQLYNAVYNLINNAIPETPKDGRIMIRTTAVPTGEFPDGGYVQIQVVDTGKGMPESVRSKLFSEHAVSTKPGGTGLGTKIVKNVVDNHEGTITVESQEGIGTTFTMRIPLRHEPPTPRKN